MNAPIASKINWTQIAGIGATALAYFGLNIPPEQLVAVIVGVQSAVALATLIFRTFFTAK